MRGRPGWTKFKKAWPVAWRHDASGWTVHHCGHPTALWPYFGAPPGHGAQCEQGDMLLYHGIGQGYAFQLLKECQAAVELHVAKERKKGRVMKKIYVASSWRNKHQPRVVCELRGLGCEVYDFRNPGPGKSGFGWRSIDAGWESWSPGQWREALSSQPASDGYANDRSGMDRSDICVLVLPCGRSAHLEAGFMAGEGKTVYTLCLESVEPDLMNLLLGPPSNICVTLDELYDRLELS